MSDRAVSINGTAIAAHPRCAEDLKFIHRRKADVQDDQIIRLVPKNIIGRFAIGQLVDWVAVAP